LKNVLQYFPINLRGKIEKEIADKFNALEEIRIRANRPIVLKFSDTEKLISSTTTTEEIISCLQLICENSIYSYQNQITEGFVTVKGGHRVGITGSCVFENGKVININNVYSLNFRIAKQIIGSGNKILKYIINTTNNTIYNTLIISSPGAGKTTVLRDIVRQLASRIDIGIVDERGEIAALYKGIPQNDVGIKTDIVENVSKSIGMKMLVRSMSPKVIVADEIGNEQDIDAINYAICSGCKGIFTAHGYNFEDININFTLKRLINIRVFERLIFLDEENKGQPKEIYNINKKTNKYEKIFVK